MTRSRTRPADPTICICRKQVHTKADGTRLHPGGRPLPIATFQNGDVVDITLQHWAGRDGCRVPAQHLNPREWLKS